MPRIATRHAHQLAYRQRFSLGVRMFGCLVLLAGAIVLAAAAAEATRGAMSGMAWRMASLGLVLAACGGLLFRGQRGKLFDRQTHTLTLWWGLVWPLSRTTRDLRPYQHIGVHPREGSGSTRWCVSLWNAQDERLELFDLAHREAARDAARQVAKFLSLALSPAPVGIKTAAAAVAPMQSRPTAAPPSDELWVYSQGFGAPVRLAGVGLLSLASVLLLGLFSSTAREESLGWLAATAPLVALGLWLLCGGRKVEIDVVEQTVRIWRAWPLPPATYELGSFHSVIVAPAARAAANGSAERQISLIGANQARLELIAALPRDSAQAAAAELAAALRMPLVEGS